MDEYIDDLEEIRFNNQFEEELLNDPQEEMEEREVPFAPEERTVPIETEIIINELPIKFPGTVEPIQMQIMETCLTGFENGSHVAIECPSDRLRTMAELAAALAWLQKIRQSVPIVPDTDNPSSCNQPQRLFIGVRATSDVNPRIDYLNAFSRTGYLSNLDVAVLAPPSQLCHKCRDDSLCDYKDDPKVNYSIVSSTTGRILNLPLFKQEGRRHGNCNYRRSRAQVKTAKLVISSQDYLTSPVLQEKYLMNLKNSMVLLDDCGNVEEAICNQVSFALTTEEMKVLAANFRKIAMLPEDPDQGLNHERYRRFRTLIQVACRFESLSRAIDTVASIIKGPTTNDLFTILVDNQFGRENDGDHNTLISDVVFWLENRASADTKAILRRNNVKVDLLLQAQKFIRTTIFINSSEGPSDFGLEISKYAPPNASTSTPPNSLRGVFRNTSRLFDALFGGCSSIVLSSACLPPWDNFKEQLSDQTQGRFLDELFVENAGPERNYFFGYCGIGPDESTIELNHGSKGLLGNLDEAGKSVYEVVDKLHDGIIVFVSSTPLLSKMRDHWVERGNQERSILEKIKSTKHVFWELDFLKKEHARKFLRQFQERCTDPLGKKTGAVLFALHRGNVSDLLSTLEKDQVSCMIALGIPFHSIHALPIKAKEAFLKKQHGEEAGKEKNNIWYNSEAWNKMSQNLAIAARKEQSKFIGLVIDNRFQNKVDKQLIAQLLPAWNRNRWRGFTSFEELIDDLGEGDFLQSSDDDDQEEEDEDL